MTTGIGAIGLASTIAGGITSAAGAAQSADAQAAMYNYNASVAKLNEQWAFQQGAAQAQQYGMKSGQVQAGIKTAQASGGIDVNSGSAAAVQSGQKTVSDIDNATIRSNAARTAYNYASQASVDTAAASNVKAAEPLNIASSILGSTASVSSKWLQGQQMGLWGGASTSSSTQPDFTGIY